MATILDGRLVAQTKEQDLKKVVAALKADGICPTFCVINIGQDPASQIYIHSKAKKAAQLGLVQRTYQLAEDVKQEQVVDLIERLNQDEQVNGIMVQLPVPKHLDQQALIDAIDPNKDIDALTTINTGRLWNDSFFVQPATASGIIDLLSYYDIQLTGKKVVIIGRSNIVGKPLASLMLGKNASVSILHSKTAELKDYTLTADIVVCAAGVPHLLKKEMVKQGAVVIDVGINRVNGQLVGDCDYDRLQAVADYITPVPGGVGPLTVICLMEQVVKLTRRQHGR